MKIAVDAFGGDHAPQEIIDGCIIALEKFPDISLILAGDKEIIAQELSKYKTDLSRIEIRHAPEIIRTEESPVDAIRHKKNSSMVVALEAVAEGAAEAFVSAGNTGAILSGATLIVKRIKGVKRPALAVIIPTANGKGVLLIDCGANVDCNPQFLCQFAIMGSAYMENVMKVANPRVGLINNGTEEEKGNTLTKATYPLLKQAPINFVGNVEARDLLSGDFDVAVCDGFDGNLILKYTEGLSMTLVDMLKTEYSRNKRSKIGALISKQALRNFKRKMDYTEYGGAPLLGINGCIIKAHGSSNGKAFMAALNQVRNYLLSDVTGKIKSGIEQIISEEE